MRSSRRKESTVDCRLLVVCLLVVNSVPARAELIERILAVVDGRPLLLSEVRLVERVRGLARTAALEAAIDERLMFREAVRLPQALPTADEEERAVRSLLDKAPALATQVSEEDLRPLARRQATILKYVGLRFSPQVRVADEEVEKAYEAEYGGRDDAPALAAVAEALKERLARRALDERIETWVGELRAAADIRYNP